MTTATASSFAVLLDLDETLVLTSRIEPLRQLGHWREAAEALDQTSLPPKTREFVAKLMRVAQVGVVTMSPKSYAEGVLAFHGLNIPVLVGYHDVARRKPFPDPIIKALALLGVPASNAIHVGDRAEDHQAAQAAGVRSILVSWTGTSENEDVCRSWDEVLTSIRTILREPMTTGPDRYPMAAVKEGLLEEWDGDDYSILRYHPRRNGTSDVPSRLLLDFKNGDAGAEALLGELALTAFQRLTPVLRDKKKCTVIVPVPSHNANAPAGPCQRLAHNLAGQFDWLEFRPVLVRHTTVPKSATSRPGERPTQQDHLASMKISGSRLAVSDRSIIMLDDVITAGETSAAARQLLLEGTGCRSVIGFFLARTMNS